MIVRSLHVVNFAGAAEARLAPLPDRGVVATNNGVAAGDALRCALANHADAAESGRAHSVVELTARLPDGRELSLFRGTDRRGAAQTSLRERQGPRLTGGDAAVRTRLAELLGVPLDVWESATWIDVPHDPGDPFAGAAPAGGAPAREARDDCDRAIDGLRRALRAAALSARVESEYASLCALGGRLRNARTAASVEAGELTAERERLRVRLRRLAEYRERAAKEQAAAPADAAPRAAARPFGWAERGSLIAGAVLVFAIVQLRAGRSLSRDPVLAALLGLSLLACVASYVAASARSAAAPRTGSDDKRGEWREALRHLYADLGDPDDPALADGLKKRLVAVERRLAPLTKRTQELDEAVAAFEIEAGRASKTTHGAVTPRADGGGALGADESPSAAEAEVARIGEALCRHAVERQTLVEGGTPEVAAAVAAVRSVVRDLGAACADESAAAAALDRAHVAGDAPPDVAGLAADEELCVRLADDVAAIGRAPRAATSDADGSAELTARAAGAEFTVAAAAGGPTVRRRGAAVAWADLPEDARERIAFALAMRRAEESLGGRAGAARFVVLDRRPPGLDDEALADLVTAAAPTAVQVFVASAAPAAVAQPASAQRVTRG